MEDPNKDNDEQKQEEMKKDEVKKEATQSPKSKLSGPQKIGLSHKDIKRAIECLPNAEKCQKYKFKFRTDMEATSTAKKAWKKTLRLKSSKKEKKEKKPQPPKDAAPSITNIHTVNNINIINNINISASPMNLPNTNKENPIVIEDSPTIDNNEKKDEGVIDLCNSDVDDNGVEKTRIIKSKTVSRKRKHPISISPDVKNNVDGDQPKKKRKIDISE